jgi:hypothetical protein
MSAVTALTALRVHAAHHLRFLSTVTNLEELVVRSASSVRVLEPARHLPALLHLNDLSSEQSQVPGAPERDYCAAAAAPVVVVGHDLEA